MNERLKPKIPKWCVILAIGIGVFWILPRIVSLEDLELGILYKFRGALPQNNSVWIVSIDEELDKTGAGIPHHRYGKLIESLTTHYQPAQIGFDVVFAKAKDKPEDIFFAQTVKSAGNVYFGFPISHKKGQVSGFTHPIKGEMETIPEIDGLSLTLLPQVLKESSGVGHLGKSKNSAYLPLVAKYQGNLYPQLALQMAADYLAKKLNIPREKLEIEMKDGKYLLLKSKEISRKIPINSTGQMLINFTQCQTKTFEEMMKTPSAVLEKGKIILIGGVKETCGDVYSTPVGSFSGVGIIASVIENIINQRFLVRVLDEVDILLILLIICLMTGWGLPRIRLWGQILLPGIILIAYGVVAVWLFKYGLWIEMFRPAFAIGFCSLGIIVTEKIRIEKEEKELKTRLKETSDKLKNLSEEKSSLLKEREVLLKKRVQLLKIEETSRKERDELIEKIEELKTQLAAKENQIKETDDKIREIEAQVKIDIDFKKREIYSPLTKKKISIKKTQPFLLLEYILREDKIHWTEGYIIFREWRKPKEQMKSKNSAFIQVVNELNSLFIKEGILGESEIVENIRGGQYQLSLKDDEYQSNIKEAKRLIESASGYLLDEEFENAGGALLKAITIDDGALEGYRLLGKITDKIPSPGIKEVLKRYDEMLSYEINRCRRAMELVQQDPGIREEEKNYVKTRLEKLEKAGNGKNNDKESSLTQALTLIKRLQTIEKGKIYSDSDFEQLLKIDFINSMVKQLPAIVAKRIFTHWGLNISEEEIMPQIPLCFFNAIKGIVLEEVRDKGSLISYLQKTLIHRLSDEIISERYGIDIKYLPQIRKFKKAQYEIEQESGKTATDEEIRQRMGCGQEEYERIKYEYLNIERQVQVEEIDR